MPKSYDEKQRPGPRRKKTGLSYKRAGFEQPRKCLRARHLRGRDRHQPQKNVLNCIFMQKKRTKNLP